jgi:ATP-binding cassette, subfamily F, member 3
MGARSDTPPTIGIEMAVVIGAGLDKDVAGTPLLRGVSFTLERGDRMTLAGRNGAGKTTLLRMLARQTSVDGGELVFEKGARVALHDQRPPRERDLTLRDYVLAGCGDLVALEERLRALESQMAERPDDTDLLDGYARTQGRLEHAGGWNWRARALTPLHGLGFGDDDLDRRLDSFSGGELTRAALARVLAADPDLLLLDEPTNHLDIASLEWLEGYLTGLDAAVILVAHDRWFLEAVGTSVLELEAGRSRFFPGPWHAWRREAAAREIALGKAIDKQHAEIARMERFLERFRYKATKARQAQSRIKALERMDRVERDPTDTRSLGFRFGPAERTGRVVLELEASRLEVPGRTLLEDGELWLERGEHVSLVGPNGAGKTTLIEALAGRRPLDAGRLRTGHNVRLGYLSQHAGELGFAGTALEAAQRATGLTPGKARALLGRFLFSGEEAEKPLDGLSGGERRRLSLAILVASDANVLILDEPTNHLDLDAREALEDALRGFEGALLLVSHDRALLDAVGTRTVAMEEGRLRSYEGGWAEYSRVREERREADAAAAATASKEPRRRPRADRDGAGAKTGAGNGDAGGETRSAAGTQAHRPAGAPSKNALRRIAELEREVERAELALRKLEDELADPARWSTPERTEESSTRHSEAKRAVEEAYARWESAAGVT